MRGGSVKAELFQQERKPWRVKGPGEPRAGLQSKPLSRVANSCVEQNPEGGGCSRGLTIVRVNEQQKLKRGTASETTDGCAGGEKLWRANPKSGSGMK
jgi:hypothetical protein